MKIQDLSMVFEGLAGGLGSGLKGKDQQELHDLAEMFRQFPEQVEKMDDIATLFERLAHGLSCTLKKKDQSAMLDLARVYRRFSSQTTADFAKFVQTSLNKERNSLPALTQRIQQFQSGNHDESVDELLTGAKSLSAGDLTKLFQALGADKPTGRKNEKLNALQSLISNSSPVTAPHVGHASSTSGEDIEEALQQYKAIQEELDEISYLELESRFHCIADYSKPVLAGLLERLGFPADDSREKMAHELLDNLRSLKSSRKRLSTIP